MIKPKEFLWQSGYFWVCFQKCGILGLWRLPLQAANKVVYSSPSLNIAVSFNWLWFYNCSSIHGGKLHLQCVIVSRLQKLALRNNCTSTTQHLRLLIRGQDQDCFQVGRVPGAVPCSFRPLTCAYHWVVLQKLWVGWW